MSEFTGLGSRLQLESKTTPGTYTDVRGVAVATPPPLVPGDVELESLDDIYIRSIPGPIEAAEVPATINLDDTGPEFEELLTIARNREIRGWRIAFPNNKGFTFRGYLKVEPQELTRSDVAQVQITIRCTELPEFGDIT